MSEAGLVYLRLVNEDGANFKSENIEGTDLGVWMEERRLFQNAKVEARQKSRYVKLKFILISDSDLNSLINFSRDGNDRNVNLWEHATRRELASLQETFNLL